MLFKWFGRLQPGPPPLRWLTARLHGVITGQSQSKSLAFVLLRHFAASGHLTYDTSRHLFFLSPTPTYPVLLTESLSGNYSVHKLLLRKLFINLVVRGVVLNHGLAWVDFFTGVVGILLYLAWSEFLSLVSRVSGNTTQVMLMTEYFAVDLGGFLRLGKAGPSLFVTSMRCISVKSTRLW